MNDGERQVAPTLDGIRRDHVARYEWASQRVKGRVLDAACGIGYGTHILARAGHQATGIDVDGEALSYGRDHYRRRGMTLKHRDIAEASGAFDWAVCFEALEHLRDPRPALRALHAVAPRLIASVPNEEAFPWRGYAFHERHYTRRQFQQLLEECGWHVQEWLGQRDDESDVERERTDGRTLIAVAKRGRELAPRPSATDGFHGHRRMNPPAHVAILGMGGSLHEYINITKGRGGRNAYCDQVWAINALGGVVDCDLIFHMDDVRIQELRAEADPRGNIAPMVRWLKHATCPVITSQAHPDYPALVEFPLERVVNDLNFAYFNSTTAYAVAYAIWIGARKISLFGLDYTYRNAHRAEQGRACVEFWLGLAAARGIDLVIPKTSSLMDACEADAGRLYGYDGVDLRICRSREHHTRFEMTPRAQLPTAEEIEERYCHERHPNPLMRDAS